MVKQAIGMVYVTYDGNDDQPVFRASAEVVRCDVATCRALVLEPDKGQHMLGHEQDVEAAGG